MWTFFLMAGVVGVLVWLWATRIFDPNTSWMDGETLKRFERHEELEEGYIQFIMEHGLEPTARELWDYTEGSEANE